MAGHALDTRRALLSVGHKKRAASCKVATERGKQNTENRAQNKTEEEEISSRSEQPILLLPLSSRARQGRSHSHRRATLSPPPWRLGAVISAKCYSFPGPIIQNIARQRTCLRISPTTTDFVAHAICPYPLPSLLNYTVSGKPC